MPAAANEPKTYMPLFIGDYLADTSDLSAEEHGAYLLLLMTMWRRGGSLPSNADRLSRIAAVSSDRWPAVWAMIGGLFDEEGGEITQKRLTQELDAARDRKAAASERARHAAQQRWAKQSADAPDDAPSMPQAMPQACPEQCSEHAPSNAPSMPEAMPEQCPSTSTSTSTSTSPPAVIDSIRFDVDAAAAEVMNYWNDLTDGGWSAESADGEYLRERLLEGHSPDTCSLVVEAAVASGIEHPRQAFSRKCFGGLLATRKDPRKWAELRDEFDATLERYGERTA